MEKKIWVSLIVLLIACVMVGESSFSLTNMNGAEGGIIEYERENLKDGACGFGVGWCCPESDCVGGTCKRRCKTGGEECGWISGKGACCSTYDCISGKCKRRCKDHGEECGWSSGKGICCSQTDCINGICKRRCKDVGEECGWSSGKGSCCALSDCVDGKCKKRCVDPVQLAAASDQRPSIADQAALSAMFATLAE